VVLLLIHSVDYDTHKQSHNKYKKIKFYRLSSRRE
jgi:hypothetical protein